MIFLLILSVLVAIVKFKLRRDWPAMKYKTILQKNKKEKKILHNYFNISIKIAWRILSAVRVLPLFAQVS